MRTINTLTPIPLVPAIPGILEALGLGAGVAGLTHAVSEASDSGATSIGSIHTMPTTLDFIKPVLQMEAAKAKDFITGVPDAYEKEMRRFLTTSSSRPVSVEEAQPTYVHAGWNRINGGYRYYDPNLGMTTETYIDPVVIEGTYTSPYDPTASLRAEPTVKITPLVNTYQRSMPIELSSGQVVVLPNDITDYRVFNEGSEVASGEGSDNSEAAADEGNTPPADPTPEQSNNEEPKKKRYRDRRREKLNRPEPEDNWDEYLRGFDHQGRPSKMNNPSFGQEWSRWPRLSYGLGYLTHFLGTPGGIITIGGVGTGLHYLRGASKNENTSESATISEEGINTNALGGNANTGTSNNGNVGTGWNVIYTEPGYNSTNFGTSGQNQGTTENQVINLSEMDSIDSLYNSRR